MICALPPFGNPLRLSKADNPSRSLPGRGVRLLTVALPYRYNISPSFDLVRLGACVIAPTVAPIAPPMIPQGSPQTSDQIAEPTAHPLRAPELTSAT